MKLVIQRVKHASVTIEGKITGQIQQGYLVLVGFCSSDTEEIAEKMATKMKNLRIFSDENDKINLSLEQVHGDILSISQFTLYADCHKGNRPSFTDAARPELASPLYDHFNTYLRSLAIHVEEGIFGADMKVDLLNDGPFTILLDSEKDIR